MIKYPEEIKMEHIERQVRKYPPIIGATNYYHIYVNNEWEIIGIEGKWSDEQDSTKISDSGERESEHD